MLGRILSHYKIKEEIGRGGMGIVYRAVDLKLDRDVALKVLPPELVADPERKKRFVKEAKAAAKLDHPHIGMVFEIDEVEGSTFIAMELIRGEKLRDTINKERPAAARALELATEVAEGMAHAHDKGIVHRDLKPANILVTDEGHAKIIDFGLAKLVEPLAGEGSEATTAFREETATGNVLGTVYYMSPEQARGQKVDHRSDIFSFGIVLYEMLTGEKPFHGASGVETLNAILKDPVPRIPDPSADAGLQRIVDKCLSKEPAERYQTMKEVVVDLRGSRRRLESGLQDPSDRSATVQPSGRTRPVYALIALAVLIAGYALYSQLFTAEAPPAKRIRAVVLPFENLGPPEAEYFAAGMTEEITSRLASVSAMGVISRVSAASYANTNKTARQIGEELDVEYVLEGTVRWAPGPEGTSRVRITPQLIEAADDTHIWTETYDRVIDDIFAIQTEIAQRVVEQLGVTLLEGEKRAVEVPPTENLEAYQAYLRGQYYAGQPHFSLETWSRVLESYERAVELDPDFALAHAELAKAHARLYYFQHDLSDERLGLAEQAAKRAIELEPDSPKVHLALGYTYLWAYRDADKALAELALAEKTLRDNAEVLTAKGYIFELQGRWEEALSSFGSAFEASPTDAALLVEIALVHWVTRQYAQGEDAANKAIALAPGAAWPYITKALIHWSWKGVTEEARAALASVPVDHSWAPWCLYWQELLSGRYVEALGVLSSTSNDWIRLKMWARPHSMLEAFAHELMGEPDVAQRAFESAKAQLESEIQSSPHDPRYHSSLGIVYAALGRKDEALREGNRAVELLPISKDAFYGIPYVHDLAHIYTLLGDHDAALDELESLLSIPSYFSPTWIEIDPRWIPLRKHPRYLEILEK